jgi:N,N'-diacetyllegionaminate synthase
MILNFRQRCLQKPEPDSDERCLVIAEVAQTHDGSLGQAHAFIDAVANAGADAIKFQTHIAGAESTPDEPWRVRFSRQDESRFEYWRRMEFTESQWAGLKEHAESRSLLFLSSPFSIQAFELLQSIGTTVWKVASGEIGNLPLLERIAATGDPVILSSGLSDWPELDHAVKTVQNRCPVAVLQCTTEYPCPPEKTGLNMMAEMRARYGCASGLSDHSGRIYAGLAAATLGADVLEVHVTFSREMFGPDVPASITTLELGQLVSGIRDIERMTTNPVDKTAMAADMTSLKNIFSKSLYSNSFLAEGTVLQECHFDLKKPGTGIAVSQLPMLVGKRLRRSLSSGQQLRFDDVEL